MLAAEHVLIDISLISCSPSFTEHSRALEYTISFLSLISNSTGATVTRNICTAERPWNVVCNLIRCVLIQKTYFAILVLTVVINTTAAAQDTTTLLKQPWQKLKIELQRKVDIAVYLTSIAGKIKKVDKILLDSVKSTAANLGAFINSSIILTA
jgi:ABC-type taurine transport system substrate-binding protein